MPNPDRPLAWVTGGRRGIGRGIAYALAEAGFDIAITDIEADADSEQTLDGIQSRGGTAVMMVGDIAAIDNHQTLLDQIIGRFGRIDCLVNNAGVSVLNRGDLLDVSAESYDRCLDINLRGTFFLTQCVARYFNARAADAGHHRSIVTISSINAIAVSVDRGEYCLAKTGLSMMTKLFALRLVEAGVGVYEVRPGVIETDMTLPAREKYTRLIAGGGIPIARWGQPEDIAKAVAALASGALPYCVGQAVAIDGGLHIVQL